jgi:hypothetical protein
MWGSSRVAAQLAASSMEIFTPAARNMRKDVGPLECPVQPENIAFYEITWYADTQVFTSMNSILVNVVHFSSSSSLASLRWSYLLTATYRTKHLWRV